MVSAKSEYPDFAVNLHLIECRVKMRTDLIKWNRNGYGFGASGRKTAMDTHDIPSSYTLINEKAKGAITYLIAIYQNPISWR